MKKQTKKHKGGYNANSIKTLLGQETYVSKTSGREIDANNIVRYLSESHVNTTSPPTKQNIKNAKKVDKLTENLVKTCNKILIKRDNECQCYDSNGIAATDYFACDKKREKADNSKCAAYNKCRRILNNSLSGSEPSYNPEDWKVNGAKIYLNLFVARSILFSASVRSSSDVA